MSRRKEPVTAAPEALPEPSGESSMPLVDATAPVLLSPRRRSGLMAALVGGALAAIGGFGLAHFNVFGLRPAPAPDLSAELAALKDQVAKLSDQAGSVATLGPTLDGLEARLAVLESRPLPEAADLSGLQALEDRLAAIETMPEGDAGSTATLAARLAKLEGALQSMPSAGDTTALRADLDAALALLSTAETEAATRTAEAEAAAAKAARDLALRALTEAVLSGQPFKDKLAALDDPALAAALGPMADSGAPTMAALQAAFPDAARETLRLSREISAEDGWTDRLVEFFADQTEARSLTPQEGTDADAILSRAEFALGEGRVADALAELSTLDPAVATPFAGWTVDANRYLAAMTALAAAGRQ